MPLITLDVLHVPLQLSKLVPIDFHAYWNRGIGQIGSFILYPCLVTRWTHRPSGLFSCTLLTLSLAASAGFSHRDGLVGVGVEGEALHSKFTVHKEPTRDVFRIDRPAPKVPAWGGTDTLQMLKVHRVGKPDIFALTMPLDIPSQLSFMETYLPAALLLWGSMLAWLLALYLMQRKDGFQLGSVPSLFH
jgi:hypothetical protein